MKQVIHPITVAFRTTLLYAARQLDTMSNGRLTPNAVTVFGLCMHLPIAILIARGRFLAAAILLLVFGLFNTLDDQLASVQNRTSDVGEVLAATADRFKEVILYAGTAYFLAAGDHPEMSVWAVVACGAALSVSYTKSKGDIIVPAFRGKQVPYTILNQMLWDGVWSFEIRIFVLFIGLLTGQVLIAIVGIAILATITALQRLIYVTSERS